MSLITLWQANRAEIEQKQIQLIVAIAGDGALRDGNKRARQRRRM